MTPLGKTLQSIVEGPTTDRQDMLTYSRVMSSDWQLACGLSQTSIKTKDRAAEQHHLVVSSAQIHYVTLKRSHCYCVCLYGGCLQRFPACFQG